MNKGKKSRKSKNSILSKNATYRNAAHLVPRRHNIVPLEIKKCPKIDSYKKVDMKRDHNLMFQKPLIECSIQVLFTNPPVTTTIPNYVL